MALEPNVLRFIAELAAQPRYNQTAAYMAVYGVTNAAVASNKASKLMSDPEVRQAWEAAESATIRRAELTKADVLEQIHQIANTDTSELVEWRVGACRYCHGAGHLAQRTPAEYRRALDLYLQSNHFRDPMGLKFPMEGGIGYDPRKKPHPDCPECFGEGVGREIIKDTRFISPAAKVLYNGVKRGKNGIEVLIRSKDKALDLAAKHTGVAKENVSIDGNLGGGGVTIYVPDNGRDSGGQNGTEGN